MALATRPKPKVQHRKRVAQHHHHGKLYLKTYWPYLPMFAIVGVGALMNRALYSSSIITSSAGAAISGSGAAGTSSRLQSLLGNQAGWIFSSAIIITAAAFACFIALHWLRFRQLINKGEMFVITRPWLEIATVAVFTFGFVLTRGANLAH